MQRKRPSKRDETWTWKTLAFVFLLCASVSSETCMQQFVIGDMQPVTQPCERLQRCDGSTTTWQQCVIEGVRQSVTVLCEACARRTRATAHRVCNELSVCGNELSRKFSLGPCYAAICHNRQRPAIDQLALYAVFRM